MQAATPSTVISNIRYNDHASYNWVWNYAPCFWNGRVKLQFTDVPLSSLRPSGCLIDPAIVAMHLSSMRAGRALAPPVVCDDGSGRWFLHDGNHRYYALREFFCDNGEAQVRVAVAVPNGGFGFIYCWFACYGTYVLQPVAPTRCSHSEVKRASPSGRWADNTSSVEDAGCHHACV